MHELTVAALNMKDFIQVFCIQILQDVQHRRFVLNNIGSGDGFIIKIVKGRCSYLVCGGNLLPFYCIMLNSCPAKYASVKNLHNYWTYEHACVVLCSVLHKYAN